MRPFYLHRAKQNLLSVSSLLLLYTFSHFVLAEQAQNTEQALDAITVHGTNDELGIELEKLDQVPGGTNLINLETFKGSQASVAKVLINEPGIIVQELFGGNDQPRINIRGSGIQDNPVSRGMQLLYDGLALNQADGSFIFGLLDPEQSRSISVYRGANANRYGGTTLGGAIDFNLRNALNLPFSSASIEVGSYGLRKVGLSLNQSEEHWDYHIQASHSQADGWRDHSEAERDNLAFNIGWENNYVENRMYVNFTDNRFEIPFLLSKERSISDPSSVLGDYDTSFDQFMNVRNRDPYRDTQQLRLANKSLWSTQNTEQSFGFYTEKVDDEFKNPVVQTNTESTNYGLDYALRYVSSNGAGDQTDYQVFVSANQGEMPREHHSVSPTNGRLLQKFADVDQNASNVVVGAQVLHSINNNLQALAALQWVENNREITDQLNNGVLNSEFNYSTFNPKVGLIYKEENNQRYYVNISQSSEAPTFWQLAISSPNPNDPLNAYLKINDLKMQTAQTIEIGTQQKTSNLNWQASYYYAQVADELISEVQDFAIDGTTVNYDHRTIHQGIELGLNARTNSGVFNHHDFLSLKVVYNWSDFRFYGGRYDKKSIAGVPVHLVYNEVGYHFSEKTSFNLNIRWQPQETYVDHSNAGLTQDPYALLGAKVTWEPSDRMDFFIDAQNMTNETYQIAYVVRGFSADDPNVPTFVPGPNFNVSTGFAFYW